MTAVMMSLEDKNHFSVHHKSLTRDSAAGRLMVDTHSHLRQLKKRPFRIYKKRKDQEFFWPNEFWNVEKSDIFLLERKV